MVLVGAGLNAEPARRSTGELLERGRAMALFCKACAVFLAVQMVPAVVGGPSAWAGERDFKTQGELYGAPIQDERDGPARSDTAPENGKPSEDGTAQRPEDSDQPLPPGCPFRDGPLELIV